MERNVFVAVVDSEVIGQQIVPNVARVVKEAKVRMARDGTRKASQAKGKLMMTKEKAKVASGKHARHLKGIAITFGNGVRWKRIVSQKPRSRVAKAKVLAASMNPRQVNQKTLQLADLVCARLETNVMTGKWNNYRKVTFTLDSGAAVSVAPKSLGDDYPMLIEEPRSCKTATGAPVQDEGFRVLPIVTEKKGIASFA